MGSNTERARKALDAMKLLGFSKKEATPVLKQLLKLFGNNWEPIEDDGYRALADAILDKLENKPDKQAINEEMREDGRESEPRNAGRVRMDDQQPSASVSGYDMDNEAETPLIKRPRMHSGNSGQQVLPPRNCREDSLEPGSIRSTEEVQGAMAPTPRGATPGSLEPIHRETWSSMQVHLAAANEEPSAIVAYKRRKELPHENSEDTVFLKVPKPEPETDLTEGVGLPLALPRANQPPAEVRGSDDTSIRHCRTRKMSTPCVDATGSMMRQSENQDNGLYHAVTTCKNGSGSTVGTVQEAPCTDFDVASSTMGEVKMSLKLNVDHSKFRMPSLESVFKMVEDKCLRSYKILPPEFSIGSLMNEICQCVVQLGSDHTTDHSIHSDVLGNGSSLQKEEVTSNVPFVKPIACKSSGHGEGKAEVEPPILEASQNGLQNSIVVQHRHLSLSELRPIHDVTDISKGEERVRISVVNEFGSKKYPPSFYYIPRNLVFQNAYVNISVARIGDEDCCADCFGNCLSAPVTCACARETGGEFAYTPEGLVRTALLDECVSMNRFPEKHHKFRCKACPLERCRNEASPEPCKGHLVRKFIKECWSKCGCNMQCGNRVVQRGITCNLQVFFTREGKGWGLRTLDELPKGAFVCEYVGEVLTNMELYERTVQNTSNSRHTYPVLLDADWGSEGVLRDEEALCLDATFYGNVGRFVNHRCYDANLVEIPVEVETPDHHYYHLAFFTTKKVEAFEELTWDYGIDFDDDDHPVKAFRCLCGSRYCRDVKHSRKRGKAAARRS